MTIDTLDPLCFALRKALTQQAMKLAADSGQTALVGTLYRLDGLCKEIDFAVVQYGHQLQQLADAMNLLLAGLDSAANQLLTAEEVRYLLEPIHQHIQNVHSGLEGLNLH